MTETQHVELAITGMTCASCANRIERKLNNLEGVSASVNYATERASVTVDGGVTTHTLVSTVEQAGYGAAPPARRTPDGGDGGLRTRLLVSAALALPVVLISMLPGLDAFAGRTWLLVALATPVVVWGGWPFHRAAAVNLRHGATTMDTLVSLGVLAAYLWSLVAAVAGAGHLYLETAVVVTTFLLGGRYAEARAKRRAGSALRELLERGAKTASRLRDGVEQQVPIDELVVGDEFVIRPGETVATDGTVIDGHSAVDASLLTGESLPVEVAPGDEVVGATINAGGRLVVRATRVGAQTQLASLARLVEAAQTGKAPAQRLADRVSARFVPVVLVLAAVTLTGWLVAGQGATSAFTAAVAVLIVACPCALGLATPTALLVGTGRGAQLGIVIRGPEVLESTRLVDTVVLDKTGTVTSGRMTVLHVDPVEGTDAADVLRFAGAVENASEHPVGRAIARAAAEAGPLPPVTAFQNTTGLGVRGAVRDGDDQLVVLVGRPSLFDGVPPATLAALEAAAGAGGTGVVVGWDGAVRGLIVVGDTVRPESAAGVRALHDLGLATVLLTGDHEATARAVADEVGIETVVAEVLPEEKVATVRRLQDAGHVVAMVGDGVNDAAALAQADLGLAMGTGTDVAIAAADLTLVRDDLRLAGDAIRLSRRTLAVIKGNLFWAFAYNVAAIPLAASGLLDPMIAGAAMAFSSVFVVGNSLRLRRFA